jgi:hypothetical protein
MARLLEEQPKLLLYMVGHTDDTGTAGGHLYGR